MELMFVPPQESVRVATGIRGLDAALFGGLDRGDLIVIGGAERSGKTAIALQVAANVAVAGGHVAFLSFELGGEALAGRLRLNPTWPRNPLDEATPRRLHLQIGVPRMSAPATFDELERARDTWWLEGGDGDWTSSQDYADFVARYICSWITDWIADLNYSFDLSLVIIDCLQQAARGLAWSPVLERLPGRLKASARQNNVPVLATSRFEKDERPRVPTDLTLLQGGRGALEGCADTIFYLEAIPSRGCWSTELMPVKPYASAKPIALLVDRKTLRISDPRHLYQPRAT